MNLSAVEIIAHRGASYDAPENTVAAVKLGWRQGADAVEIDIRQTADGAIVALHDETLKRTAGLDKPLTEVSLREARELEVGAWKADQWKGELIPVLDEILETIPEGKKLFIEIKSGPEILPELVKSLKGFGRDEAIVLIGFDFDTMKKAKELMPQYPNYWLVSFKKNDAGQWAPPVEEALEKAKGAGLEGINVSQKGPLNAGHVKQANEMGLGVYVWTVNEIERAKELAAMGVNGITTDRPEYLRKALSAP